MTLHPLPHPPPRFLHCSFLHDEVNLNHHGVNRILDGEVDLDHIQMAGTEWVGRGCGLSSWMGEIGITMFRRSHIRESVLLLFQLLSNFRCHGLDPERPRRKPHPAGNWKPTLETTSKRCRSQKPWSSLSLEDSTNTSERSLFIPCLGLKRVYAIFAQVDGESMADYRKKGGDISLRLPSHELHVGVATSKGMRDTVKRDLVSIECSKDVYFSLLTSLRNF